VELIQEVEEDLVVEEVLSEVTELLEEVELLFLEFRLFLTQVKLQDHLQLQHLVQILYFNLLEQVLTQRKKLWHIL
jgi:hypothetical protein